MLCAICVSLFENDPVILAGVSRANIASVVEGQHHASLENLRTAAKQGCYLCSELCLEYDEAEHDEKLTELITEDTKFLTFELRVNPENHRIGWLWFQFVKEDISTSTYDILYTEGLVKPAKYDEFLQAVRADLTSDPWRVRDDGFPSSSAVVPKSTGDPGTLKIAAQWLKNCLENHSNCESREFSTAAPWYPKRLLDLSSTNGEIRLIETKEHVPKERYATLSHCWGPNPICRLTTDNIGEYKMRLPNSILTNTFRDAVAAVRMLQIRYLWIDALCIIQAGDDGKDWLVHATTMRLVYSNSLLNIAAADAEEGVDGMFNEREAAFLKPCHVLWKWSTIWKDSNDDENVFWTIRRGLHHYGTFLKLLPLYSRGWVMQERFLAPRVLHFAQDRIMWECCELAFAEESFPAGFQESCPKFEPILKWPFHGIRHYPKKDSIDEFRSPDEDEDANHVLWQDMIDTYTNCDLSFPNKDIFVALAGIAEKIGQGYDHQYVAGFFRQHLPYDLLWEHRGEIAETRRAPSWSWASIDGPVVMFRHGDVAMSDKNCTRFADVQDVKVEPVDANFIYGQVKSAELTLKGYLLRCQIKPLLEAGPGLLSQLKIYIQTDDTASSIQALCEASFDELAKQLFGYAPRSPDTVWLLPIAELRTALKTGRLHCGLIVEASSKNLYRRIGVYWVWGSVMDEVEQCGQYKMQEIVLI